jgi:hypothetical protein
MSRGNAGLVAIYKITSIAHDFQKPGIFVFKSIPYLMTSATAAGRTSIELIFAHG